MVKDILERLASHRGAKVEKGLHGCSAPAHLPFPVHLFADDLIGRTLDERR
jgi:hypothetical protein